MSASARGGAHPRTRRAFALKRSERWNRFSASHVLGTSLSDVKICKMQVRNGNVLHQNTVAGIDCNQGVVSGRRRGSEGGGGIRKNAVPELQYIATRREIGDDVLAGGLYGRRTCRSPSCPTSDPTDTDFRWKHFPRFTSQREPMR